MNSPIAGFAFNFLESAKQKASTPIGNIPFTTTESQIENSARPLIVTFFKTLDESAGIIAQITVAKPTTHPAFSRDTFNTSVTLATSASKRPMDAPNAPR